MTFFTTRQDAGGEQRSLKLLASLGFNHTVKKGSSSKAHQVESKTEFGEND